MVNRNEKEIVERYEREGWKTLRGGSPDFLFLKTENGEIKDFMFVEVKPPNGKLTYAQQIYRKILRKLGAKYKVETVQSSSGQSAPTQTNPNQPVPAQVDPSHTKPNQTRPIQSNPIPKEVRTDEVEPRA